MNIRDLPLKNGDPMEVASLFTDSAVMGSGTGAPQLLVDGVESDSLDVPVASIKQIEVNRSPYSAEYGRPGRGRVEITTKRGAHHRYHGNLTSMLTNRNEMADLVEGVLGLDNRPQARPLLP
jgi:outer membrane cobalamin receptor